MWGISLEEERERMTTEGLVLLVELIGAIGVIVSLVYLAVQVRQNTNQVIATNLKAVVDRWMDVVREMNRTTDDVNLMRRALNDFESLSSDEKGVATGHMLQLIAAYHAIMELHNRNLINPEVFLATTDSMAGYLKCPGGREWWNMMRTGTPKDLVAQLDRVIEESEMGPWTETLPYLRPES